MWNKFKSYLTLPKVHFTLKQPVFFSARQQKVHVFYFLSATSYRIMKVKCFGSREEVHYTRFYGFSADVLKVIRNLVGYYKCNYNDKYAKCIYENVKDMKNHPRSIIIMFIISFGNNPPLKIDIPFPLSVPCFRS